MQPMTDLEELQQLRQLIVNADFVAREKFKPFGICDCIDNSGYAYQSQWAEGLIRCAKQYCQHDDKRPAVSEITTCRKRTTELE